MPPPRAPAHSGIGWANLAQQVQSANPQGWAHLAQQVQQAPSPRSRRGMQPQSQSQGMYWNPLNPRPIRNAAGQTPYQQFAQRHPRAKQVIDASVGNLGRAVGTLFQFNYPTFPLGLAVEYALRRRGVPGSWSMGASLLTGAVTTHALNKFAQPGKSQTEYEPGPLGLTSFGVDLATGGGRYYPKDYASFRENWINQGGKVENLPSSGEYERAMSPEYKKKRNYGNFTYREAGDSPYKDQASLDVFGYQFPVPFTKREGIGYLKDTGRADVKDSVEAQVEYSPQYTPSPAHEALYKQEYGASAGAVNYDPLIRKQLGRQLGLNYRESRDADFSQILGGTSPPPQRDPLIQSDESDQAIPLSQAYSYSNYRQQMDQYYRQFSARMGQYGNL